MISRTHDLAAITALGAVLILAPAQHLNLATVLVAILANQIGGIAPDIDQPTAPFWRNLPIGGVVGRIIDKLLGGHRFITHSLLGLVLFGFLTHLLLQFLQPIIPTIDIWIVWLAFMIGMLSHLIMDSFTKEGVPWLLPVPIKFGFPPIRRLRITTGKYIERFVILPGLLVLNCWYCGAHYSELLAMVRSWL
jgi:inner membrane protein